MNLFCRSVVLASVVSCLLTLPGCVAFEPEPGVITSNYGPVYRTSTTRRVVRRDYWRCRTAGGPAVSGYSLSSTRSSALKRCVYGRYSGCRLSMTRCRRYR